MTCGYCEMCPVEMQVQCDCSHDYEQPIRKGRAHYVCRLCGADISVEVVLLGKALDKKLGVR